MSVQCRIGSTGFHDLFTTSEEFWGEVGGGGRNPGFWFLVFFFFGGGIVRGPFFFFSLQLDKCRAHAL